jgi:hypothetical protein
MLVPLICDKSSKSRKRSGSGISEELSSHGSLPNNEGFLGLGASAQALGRKARAISMQEELVEEKKVAEEP